MLIGVNNLLSFNIAKLSDKSDNISATNPVFAFDNKVKAEEQLQWDHKYWAARARGAVGGATLGLHNTIGEPTSQFWLRVL